jgi:hypothetical protein
LDRAARMAGKSPPNNPSAHASNTAIITNEGVMLNE